MKRPAPHHPPLLEVEDLAVAFPIGGRQRIHALSGVSFHIARGESLGLVGESGCGKSTLARTIVLLETPTGGQIRFEGETLEGCSAGRLRDIRPKMQMIFQDAAASLNPGRSVGRSIAEPLRASGGGGRRARMAAARRLLAEVGLDPDRDFGRFPFEFSGGECQRVSIARALITRPKLLICDEPVSSLDVSVQAQILNLLARMKARYDLTLLFISHDLAVVKHICDRVAVMYLGKLCEIAGAEVLYRAPLHPYTAALLAAHPEPAPGRKAAPIDLQAAEIPSPVSPPAGCRFHTRCPCSRQVCIDAEPELRTIAAGRRVACHYPL